MADADSSSAGGSSQTPKYSRTDAQKQAALAENLIAARRQVHFDEDAIDQLIPRIPKEDATLLRRLSAGTSGPRMSTAAAAAVTETLRDDDVDG